MTNHLIKYDHKENIMDLSWTAKTTLDTTSHVREAFTDMVSVVKKLGHRVYLITDVTNLALVQPPIPKITDDWTMLTKWALDNYFYGIVRFNGGAHLRMTMRATSVAAGLSSNLFATREQALTEINRRKANEKERPIKLVEMPDE